MSPAVVESVSCFSEEMGGLSGMVPTAAIIRAWHVPQLVSPASEPFKPIIWGLEQSISGLIFQVQLLRRAQVHVFVAAASFPSVWCLKEWGRVKKCFLSFFFILALVPVKDSLG